MNDPFRIVLTEISYAGENIGNDFEITLDAQEKLLANGNTIPTGPATKTPIKARIDHGTSRMFAQTVFTGRLPGPGQKPVIVEISASEILEKDTQARFDDRGMGRLLIPVQAGGVKGPIRFAARVIGDPVGDRRRVATLTFYFELRIGAGEERPEPQGPFITSTPVGPVTERVQRGSTMLAFVSDLHLGGDPNTDDWDAREDGLIFAAALANLSALATATRCRVELVLLGDILDLWETTEHYTNDDGIADMVSRSLAKVEKIRRRHPEFFQALRAFTANPLCTVVYVKGNHDDDVENTAIRDAVKKLMPYPFILANNERYVNAGFKVIACHGHQFDVFNRAERFGDRPVGRLITEEFATQVEQISQNLSMSLVNPRLEFPFSDVDAFQKESEFLDYVSCLSSTARLNSDTRAMLNRLLERALDFPIPFDFRAPGLTVVDTIVLQAILDLFVNSPVGEEAGRVFLDFIINQPSPYDMFRTYLTLKSWFRTRPSVADAMSLLAEGDYRCALMGHTHGEMIVPIEGSRLYVNTGTWMDKVSFDKLKGGSGCALTRLPHRHLTLLYRNATDPNVVSVQLYAFPGPTVLQSATYRLA